jgi:hypothetical protein
VKVFLLLAKTAGGVPDLPAGFEAQVRQGNPINSVEWRTVGVQELNDVRVNSPRVAAFDLPSTLLPQPGASAGGGAHCLLALLHSPDDGFANGQRAVAQLIVGERKATYRSIKVVAFGGVHPGMAVHDVGGAGGPEE